MREKRTIRFRNPFVEEGLWLKGNLHAHTAESDGVLSPRQTAYLYRRSGYDFLAITDHGRLTDVSGLQEEGLTLLPGEELSVGLSEAGTTFHVVGINIREPVRVQDGSADDDPQTVVDEITAQAGVALVCHPYWSSLTVNDLLRLNGYVGIEVFNSSCFLSVGRGYSLVHWDDLLVRGRRVYGFATDDAHWHFSDHRPVDTCVAWVMVKARSRTATDIVKAIGEGFFYSSQGPEIKEVAVEADRISVETSPVKAINFMSNPDLGERFTAGEGQLITAASYTLRGQETYVRVECTDQLSRSAWTNPIFCT